MEQATISVSARDHAFELAQSYHKLAKLCVSGGEHHVSLDENSALEEVDHAMALNEVIRIRMATVRSVRESLPVGISAPVH